MTRKRRAMYRGTEPPSMEELSDHSCAAYSVMEVLAKVARLEPLQAGEVAYVRRTVERLEETHRDMERAKPYLDKLANAMHRPTLKAHEILKYSFDIVRDVMAARDEEARQSEKQMLNDIFGPRTSKLRAHNWKPTGHMWSGSTYKVRPYDDT